MNTNETIRHKAIKGGEWIFALRIITRLFDLVRTLILARLLVPSDFGLIGIAIISMSALETFSQTGFETALIRKKSITSQFLDTTWSILLLRGIFLFVVIFASAPLVATFFKNPQVTNVLRVISISLILSGISNIGVLYFTKELEFRKQFTLQISSVIANTVISIPLAILFRNVWALVLGLLAGSVTYCLMSYLMHPYRPKFKIEPEKAKELLNFGKYVFVSGILIFFITQGDDIFVGRFLGAAALGLYAMAYKLSNVPVTEISHTISNVTFPVYSKLQDNKIALRETHLKTTQIIALISFPLAGGLFVLAPELTQHLLGSKWMGMVPAMQILCLYGIMRAIASPSGSFYYAIKRPDIPTKISFLQLALFAILVYPITMKFGITGAAMATTIPMIVAHSIGTGIFIKKIDCSASRFFKNILAPIGGTSVMMGTIFGVRMLFHKPMNLQGLIISILLGILVYILFSYSIDSLLKTGLRSNISVIFQELRR